MLSPLRVYENYDLELQRYEEIFQQQQSYYHQEQSQSLPQWFQQLQQQQQQAAAAASGSSHNDLETIQEEDEEIQFCREVEKLSKSGLMFNKRVLSLESEHLCYYSQTKVVEDEKINTLKHQPKVRIALENIVSVTIPTNKPNCIRVEGAGEIIMKKSTKKSAKFSYLFKFPDQSLPILWRNLILAAQEARKTKSYIVTFENLLKQSRSSSCSSNSSSSSASSSA